MRPFVVYAWLMAALLLLIAGEGARHEHWHESAAAVAVGAILILLAHWGKRRVDRKRRQFDAQVAAYERGISA